ncbi:SRPBCC family protein [Streptomyces sp. NBC_01803]|uniref:SRPBCC family protein n=1 Tax=Streptomyces sp. NBC_01803 TaxID=2975946 RepID=UPI002DD9045C|nr:SRPBCC domain-containing protein [Streptomyces sp. NBC_01803]WSA46094.1 SRPBCC domain-containing protein [Streptomyces sp. NBC_01803]
MSATTTGYTVTRELDAPVAEVWDAWTLRERFAQWFGAPLPSVELDVRPGGAWRSTLVAPEGNEYPLTGTYPVVEPRRRLVTAMDIPGQDEPALMDMVLEELDGGRRTRLVIRQECRTAEECAEAEQGTLILLGSLTEFLAGER